MFVDWGIRPLDHSMKAPDSHEDAAWIENVKRLPRARMLVDHLAAFDATIACGGVKGIEAPSEQTSTWRRLFCHDYFKHNAPLGVPVKASGKLPKCIGILNLSGKHCIYYTDSYTLCKVVCLSCQQVQPEIVTGINAVIEKAEELESGILFCFCLPFQSGLERAHWDVRTIRKTAKGAVKDGELCFSSGDGEPRTVPCTKTLENWPETVMTELVRRLANTAMPVCLDREEDEEHDVRMTPEAMESMIEILKSNRRKVIDDHARELQAIEQKHHVDLTNALGRAEEAEQDASIRIAKVAHASKTAEEVMQKKMEHVETHNATLREQLLTQQNALLEAKATLAGYKLEKEQEVKEYAARQKTLEAQVSKLKSDQARQTTEQARTLKERERQHDEKTTALNSKITELNATIKSTTAASRAVQASSKQAHSEVTALKTELGELQRMGAAADLPLRKGRVMRALLAVASVRITAEREERKSTRALLAAQDATLKDKDEQFKALESESKATIESLRASLVESDAPPPAPTDDSATLDQKLKESRREIGRKEHLLREMEKRTRSLEKQLYESDAEVKKLKEQDMDAKRLAMSTPSPTPPSHREDRCGNTNNHQARPEDGHRSFAQNTVNVNQNTAVFMSHPPQPHQQAFPNSKFVVDPQLENTISQLHTALNCITAMARSSSANSKQAELTQAKLDALSCFGICTQPVFYDSSMQPNGCAYHRW